MSRRVRLPETFANWASQYLPLANIDAVQFRLTRRIPFAWLIGKRRILGLTLWNRVYLIESCWHVEPLSRTTVELVLHELVHVAQFRRNPIFFPFQYVLRHFRYGYQGNPAEIEARNRSAALARELFAGEIRLY